MQHHAERPLGFDPVSASDEQILAYSRLYNLERETLALQDRLVRFGRRAIKQIKQNRIPANSRFRGSLPPELAEAASPADADVVRWFADLVVSRAYETPALAEFERHKFETDQTRLRLLAWFSKQTEEVREAVSDEMPLEQLTQRRQAIENAKKRKEIYEALISEGVPSSSIESLDLAGIRTFRAKLRGERNADHLRKTTLLRLLAQVGILTHEIPASPTLEQLEALYAPHRAAKEDKLAREKFRQWFTAKQIVLPVDFDRLPLPDLDRMKQTSVAALKDAKKTSQLLQWFAARRVDVAGLEDAAALEAKKAELVAAEKKKREEAKLAKRVERARTAAAKFHAKGKLTAFDHRETDDVTILAWFEQEVEKKKQK